MSRLLACVLILCSAATAHGQDWFQLDPPADVSMWMQVTFTPEFADGPPEVLFGPGHYVATTMFWLPYEQGGVRAVTPRLGANVFMNVSLGFEIFAGVHAVTITRLGDIYAPFRNTALQDFRYTSTAGVRDATEAVAFEIIPEPSALAIFATAATALGALRRRC